MDRGTRARGVSVDVLGWETALGWRREVAGVGQDAGGRRAQWRLERAGGP